MLSLLALRVLYWYFSWYKSTNTDAVKKAGDVTFPVDFFEKGVCITPKVKFTGDVAGRALPPDSRKNIAPAGAACLTSTKALDLLVQKYKYGWESPAAGQTHA